MQNLLFLNGEMFVLGSGSRRNSVGRKKTGEKIRMAELARQTDAISISSGSRRRAGEFRSSFTNLFCVQSARKSHHCWTEDRFL
jgi:hypothetical protein